jgi:hypothetical protein
MIVGPPRKRNTCRYRTWRCLTLPLVHQVRAYLGGKAEHYTKSSSPSCGHERVSTLHRSIPLPLSFLPAAALP